MGPDRERALSKYHRLAGGYDRVIGAGRLIGVDRARRIAVDRLRLGPGGFVVDVGCGTGLSFGLLEERIGPDGTLIGIEQSPEMITEARERVEVNGWRNVTLVESPVEEAAIPIAADAALFCLVHDITRMRPALENVVGHLKPGGRVAVFGAKAPPRWALPLNLAGRAMMARYVTTFEGAERPWTLLEELVPDLSVEARLLRPTYLAWGSAGHAATEVTDRRDRPPRRAD